MFEAKEVMPYELCIILLWVSVQPPKIIQHSLATIICSAKRAGATRNRRLLFMLRYIPTFPSEVLKRKHLILHIEKTYESVLYKLSQRVCGSNTHYFI
jgi:hypothetical protein